MPGNDVWAMGLHAGVRKRFKARVVKLRKRFPRIVVKYYATESGGTHPLELPDPNTAVRPPVLELWSTSTTTPHSNRPRSSLCGRQYLTMTDLEAATLILP